LNSVSLIDSTPWNLRGLVSPLTFRSTGSLPSLPSSTFWRLPDLCHQLVERFVVAFGERKEGIWSLEHSFPHWLWDLFGQQQKFRFITVENLCQPVDQSLGWVFSARHVARLDPRQVRETDADMRGQTS
jgi:hypothetical protein